MFEKIFQKSNFQGKFSGEFKDLAINRLNFLVLHAKEAATLDEPELHECSCDMLLVDLPRASGARQHVSDCVLGFLYNALSLYVVHVCLPCSCGPSRASRVVKTSQSLQSEENYSSQHMCRQLAMLTNGADLTVLDQRIF